MSTQPASTRPAWLTLKGALALLVLIFAVLGAAGVIPFTAVWVFGLLAVLALAFVVPL